MKPSATTTLPERVWRTIELDADTGCWLWRASCNAAGYGQVMVAGKPWRVHRLVYTDQVGAIPEGLVLDHLCRVRSCCNPGHLEPVTDRVNVVERGTGPAAIFAAATHCVNGHPFDEDNTRLTPRGHRDCKTCHRDSYRRNAGKRNAQRSERVTCPICEKPLARSSLNTHRRIMHAPESD